MVKKKNEQELDVMLGQLEKIVGELENNQISLESSLKYFEEGVELYKKCKKTLESAEKKVKVLTDSLKEEDLKSDQ